jgi:hypothetical protein
MSLFIIIAGAAFLIWNFLYTMSFCTWTWRNKNRFGAVAIFLAVAVSIALPVYVILIRG